MINRQTQLIESLIMAYIELSHLTEDNKASKWEEIRKLSKELSDLTD